MSSNLIRRVVARTLCDTGIESASELRAGKMYTLIYAYIRSNCNFLDADALKSDGDGCVHPSTLLSMVFLVMHFTLDSVATKGNVVLTLHMRTQDVDVVGSTHETDAEHMRAHLARTHGAFVLPVAILGSNVRIFERDAVSSLFG